MLALVSFFALSRLRAFALCVLGLSLSACPAEVQVTSLSALSAAPVPATAPSIEKVPAGALGQTVAITVKMEMSGFPDEIIQSPQIQKALRGGERNFMRALTEVFISAGLRVVTGPSADHDLSVSVIDLHEKEKGWTTLTVNSKSVVVAIVKMTWSNPGTTDEIVDFEAATLVNKLLRSPEFVAYAEKVGPSPAVATARPASSVAQPTDPPSQTVASDADKETAGALFKAANDLRDRGNMSDALPKYQAAYELVQTPVLALGLAKAYAATGQLIKARQLLLSVPRIPVRANESALSTSARSDSAKLADDLQPRIPSVVLKRGAGAQAPTVLIDDQIVPAAALDVPRKVDPGHHVIVVKRPGGERRLEVNLAEGETKSVDLP